MYKDSNILIAEFMGRRGKHNNYLFTFPGLYKITGDTWIHEDGLKFHESWDWLIPVLNKIYSSDEYYTYLSKINTTFYNGITINTAFIEVTYQEIIEYLNWLNKNK